ncbi:ATP-dependent DNA ligase [Calidifontibacter sp. DB0510]|uniref:DNA ligase n=1 Tax=Metallococcus carri TaxID=1656884 RepID=A0A967B562_9MICO|nr:ATP-dependent DNA ligase [Metallococcus carri]NHN54836.1 ATP-dependent DNA ligase [Metallococcus carri]NOP37181.1 ATP-dependent DNA ligase [Calidifontibacter sp. DB2511S]
MLLDRVAEVSAQVAATSGRNAKVTLIADLLREAQADERALVADYLTGRLPQGRIGVGWRSLSEDSPPAAEPSLTVTEIDSTFTELDATRGTGSSARRAELLSAVWRSATDRERTLLRGLLLGDLRQGAGDGIMLKAIAEAAGVTEAAVRRAVMLAGFAGPVAATALAEGEPGLAEIGLEVGRPVRPMLAGSAPDVAAAVTGGPQSIEVKLDGIRCQAHKRGDQVWLFTRSLDDITDRLPEIASAVRSLAADTLVLDGEVIALREDGSPHPFQVTGARTASRGDPDELARATPLTPLFFDLLHVDGQDLIDRPASERRQALESLVPSEWVVTAEPVTDPVAAQAFFDDWVARGHEGVIVKATDSAYAAGRRGAGWVKVKPRHTVDLVVLAVEHGSGRRKGYLSNIHLGARVGDELVMVGKTFKGMTDAMLAWQTERFTELTVDDNGWVVSLRPEQVVEIAFDGLQTSRRYPGGVALRFARVIRYRDDKTAEQADTLDTLRRVAGMVEGNA